MRHAQNRVCDRPLTHVSSIYCSKGVTQDALEDRSNYNLRILRFRPYLIQVNRWGWGSLWGHPTLAVASGASLNGQPMLNWKGAVSVTNFDPKEKCITY